MPFFILFFSLFSPAVFAVDISVSLDRSPVNVDESFQILFTANESPDGEPDFSPLEHDFAIQSQSENSRFELINGQSNHIVQWVVTVTANDAGNLTIPVIKFGNDASNELKINVSSSKTNQNGAAHDENLYLEVTTNTDKPFIRSQVLYTVKFYRRVELAKANLSEPQLNDAIIEKLGDDALYNTQVNGVAYAVIERKYAIFPQKSGEYTIRPLVLNSDILTRTPQGINSFFGSQVTQHRVIKSNLVVLNVQPLPKNVDADHWLTAENVELSETWSGDTAKMKIGEPVTRTVKLKVQGSTKGQLPQLNTVSVEPELKVYHDQPILHEDKDDSGIVASREEKVVFIPTVTGTRTLPAVQVVWFNTKTHKTEVALLPEVTLTTSETDLQSSKIPPEQQKIPDIQSTEEVTPEKNMIPPVTEAPPVTENKSNVLFPIIASISTVGWLITLSYLFFERQKKNKVVGVTETPEETNLKICTNKLKSACFSDNPHDAKIALLEWGKIQFHAHSLGRIAPHCEARLRDEILHLNAILYAKEKQIETWQGKELFKAFSENNARTKFSSAKSIDTLPPLYKLK